MKPIHNFYDSLKKSESAKFEPFWSSVYAELFPNLVHVSKIVTDLNLQRQGIDRIITLDNGRTIFIDEKVRFSEYNDILLEYLGDKEDNRKGWIEKQLNIDYLCYAFINSKTCYVFDWNILQRVWKYYGAIWKKKYKTIEAKNNFCGNEYTSISVAIPTKVLLSKISDASVIKIK